MLLVRQQQEDGLSKWMTGLARGADHVHPCVGKRNPIVLFERAGRLSGFTESTSAALALTRRIDGGTLDTQLKPVVRLERLERDLVIVIPHELHCHGGNPGHEFFKRFRVRRRLRGRRHSFLKQMLTRRRGWRKWQIS